MALFIGDEEEFDAVGAHSWEPWGDELAFRRSYRTPSLKRLGIRYRRPY